MRASGAAAHIGERCHPITEEHHSEGRDQQIVFVQRGRGGIGLPPIDIGDAGGARAPFALSKHRPGNVQPRHAAGGSHGARKLQRRCTTATTDIHHPFAGTRRGKSEQGVRHRRERDVGVLLSSHPDIATFPVPEGKHVGVDLCRRGHASPPPGRVRTLRYCRADRKRRRPSLYDALT
jgi:hypothetical protein